MPYSRPQLKLLLLLALTLLTGLGVREWRAGYPDLAERLERFDREEPVVPPVAPPPPERRRPSGARMAPASAARMERVEPAGEPSSENGTSPASADASPRASAASDPRPLDINSASLGELSRLPGVGQNLAGRILAERERRGRFESPEALRYVLGMGPKKLAAIREMVTVVAGSSEGVPTPVAPEAIPATPPDPSGAITTTPSSAEPP